MWGWDQRVCTVLHVLLPSSCCCGACAPHEPRLFGLLWLCAPYAAVVSCINRLPPPSLLQGVWVHIFRPEVSAGSAEWASPATGKLSSLASKYRRKMEELCHRWGVDYLGGEWYNDNPR